MSRRLAEELGVQRELLYTGAEDIRSGGADGIALDGSAIEQRGPAIHEASAAVIVHGAAAEQRRIEELERKIGQQQLDLDFFRAALRHVREQRRKKGEPGETHIYAVIRAEMERQGDHIGIERMCALAGVSRAGYYRHWLASEPREEETALRDEIQRLSLAQRKNGYRIMATGRSRSSFSARAGR